MGPWWKKELKIDVLKEVSRLIVRNLFPSALFLHRYSRRTAEAGLNSRSIIISFDCDTDEDAPASQEIVEWLLKRNINAVFAVPGETLIQNSLAYQSISSEGFEFMNHGYRRHGEYDSEMKRYYGVTWYHEMSFESVIQDINKGHHAVVETLKKQPLGFRAPHFGTFQKQNQLEVIYSQLSSLGYMYASTTVPSFGMRHGACFKTRFGVREFPVSGMYDYPYWILDSWSFLAAPERRYNGNDYVVQYRKMIDFFSQRGLPCILNYYVDPSHVSSFAGFYECIEYALNRKFEFTTYSAIAKLLNASKVCAE